MVLTIYHIINNIVLLKHQWYINMSHNMCLNAATGLLPPTQPTTSVESGGLQTPGETKGPECSSTYSCHTAQKMKPQTVLLLAPAGKDNRVTEQEMDSLKSKLYFGKTETQRSSHLCAYVFIFLGLLVQELV